MIKDKEAVARRIESVSELLLKVLASKQFLIASLGLWLGGAVTLLVIQVIQRR